MIWPGQLSPSSTASSSLKRAGSPGAMRTRYSPTKVGLPSRSTLKLACADFEQRTDHVADLLIEKAVAFDVEPVG